MRLTRGRWRRLRRRRHVGYEDLETPAVDVGDMAQDVRRTALGARSGVVPRVTKLRASEKTLVQPRCHGAGHDHLVRLQRLRLELQERGGVTAIRPGEARGAAHRD